MSLPRALLGMLAWAVVYSSPVWAAAIIWAVLT